MANQFSKCEIFNYWIKSLDSQCFLPFVVSTDQQVVALSTNLPYHPLNAWSSPVRGQLNGFVHGGFQVSMLRYRVSVPRRTMKDDPSLRYRSEQVGVLVASEPGTNVYTFDTLPKMCVHIRTLCFLCHVVS